jgi:molybdate transport system substrate-binding protein
MKTAARRAVVWAMLIGVVTAAGPAYAAEIHVLAAGAVRSVLVELIPAFERESGHRITAAYGPVGVTRKRLTTDPADVVILTDVAIDDLIKQDAVVAGSRVDLGRTAMGVGVRDGAPRPDIATADAFKKALLDVRSIAYVDPAQGATSGVHFASVLQRFGIVDAMKPKTTLVPGGYPAELVAKGEVDMVVHQISEIVPVKGVTLVGPLPRDVQKYTVYSSGIARKATTPDAARAFIEYLMSAAARPKFSAAGLDYRE